MSRIPNDLDRHEARLAQMEGAQMLLYSMGILGERIVGFQLELDDVVESIIVRRVTQSEFESIMNDAAGAAARERGRDGGA